jgi:hypothetical protein
MVGEGDAFVLSRYDSQIRWPVGHMAAKLKQWWNCDGV